MLYNESVNFKLKYYKMTGQLIDGRQIADKILIKTAEHVAELKQKGIHLKLAVILVGDDKPSATYVRKKGEAAEKVGIKFDLHTFPADINTADLVSELKKIQNEFLEVIS